MESVDLNTCSICKKEVKTIIKHHITYSPEEIILVCKDCHWLIHFSSEYPELCPSKEESKEFYSKQNILTISITEAQKQFINEYSISPSKLFQKEIKKLMEKESKKNDEK